MPAHLLLYPIHILLSVAILFPDIFCLNLSSSRRIVTFFAISFESSGSTRNPFTPSLTISGTPPTFEATIGRPDAIASRFTFAKPSDKLGRTKISDAIRRLRTSLFLISPANRTRSSKSSCFARICKLALSEPSPTRIKRACLCFSLTIFMASIRYLCPLIGCSLPTATMIFSSSFIFKPARHFSADNPLNLSRSMPLGITKIFLFKNVCHFSFHVFS